eukprot:1145108-Pelagomonas_calceolata.AAC.1
MVAAQRQHADRCKLINAKLVTLYTIVLGVGGTYYTEHTLNQFKQLGLDHQRSIKLLINFMSILSHHHPLVHLHSKPSLSRRQARWMDLLSQLRVPFVITYAKGSTNVADPVSCNPLLYNVATPKSVICAGALWVLGAVMTRGCAWLVDEGWF